MTNGLEVLLNKLDNLLGKLTHASFSASIPMLTGASIGGHTRHIIEIINCLTVALSSGTVDYFNRSRNMKLEHELDLCREMILQIHAQLCLKDQPLKLYTSGDVYIPTTYFRELVYVTHHTVHHMAMIKVALYHLNYVELVDENFGVESSTIFYREATTSEKLL